MHFVMDSLLVNLRVLSQVKEHTRLNTKQGILSLEQPWFFMGPLRWWRGESRYQCIEAVQRILDQALLDMELCRQVEGYHKEAALLHKAISESLIGVQALANTYSDDPPTHAKLSVIIENAKTKLEITT